MPLTASKTATWTRARARLALGGGVLLLRMLPTVMLTQSVMTSARTGSATPSRAAAQSPKTNSLRSMVSLSSKAMRRISSRDVREVDLLLKRLARIQDRAPWHQWAPAQAPHHPGPLLPPPRHPPHREKREKSKTASSGFPSPGRREAVGEGTGVRDWAGGAPAIPSQYIGTEGSTWRLQAWMPPARLMARE